MLRFACAVRQVTITKPSVLYRVVMPIEGELGPFIRQAVFELPKVPKDSKGTLILSNAVWTLQEGPAGHFGELRTFSSFLVSEETPLR